VLLAISTRDHIIRHIILEASAKDLAAGLRIAPLRSK
jgi:hypothetical protein